MPFRDIKNVCITYPIGWERRYEDCGWGTVPIGVPTPGSWHGGVWPLEEPSEDPVQSAQAKGSIFPRGSKLRARFHASCNSPRCIDAHSLPNPVPATEDRPLLRP